MPPEACPIRFSRARDAAAAFLKTGNPEDEYFTDYIQSTAAARGNVHNRHFPGAESHAFHRSKRNWTPLYDAVYLGLSSK